MPIAKRTLPFTPTPPRALLDQALAATLWFEPSASELEALKALLDTGSALRVARAGATELPPPLAGPAATLLRQAVVLTPEPVRSYFAVCALEAWRRVPVRQLAGWSGIPYILLKRRLAATGLTPGSVAAWNLALHATWLLDVAELPPRAVMYCMQLGRPAALGAVLGARGVPFFGGQVQPGAFAATLNRYLDVLRAAFSA